MLLSTSVFSKINPTSRNIELSVEAEVNKNSIGKLTLIVNPDDKLMIKWDEFGPIVNRFLSDENVNLLSKNVEDNLITDKKLEVFGFLVKFDLSDFSLKVSIPITMIKSQVLSFKSEEISLNVADPSKISGFMNLYSSYVYVNNKSNKETSEQFALRSEMVMNIHDWVLENDEEYFPTDTPDEPSVKRLGSRIVHDLPSSGMRVTIGDQYTTGSYFQSSSSILGLSLAHNYSLVSDKIFRPNTSRSFTLTSPSSVEVMIDDNVVKRLNLDSGVYQLDDIPLNEGNNNITLKITDSAGVVSYINFDVTTGLDLFSKGDLKYQVFLGVPSQLNDKLYYNYDEPLISGYLDYGVVEGWTIGVNAQADNYLQQVGFKNIFASKIGQIAFENAFSMSDQVIGSAYRFVYSTFTDNSIRHRVFSLGYEHASQDFLALGYRPSSKNSLPHREHIIQANYSFFNTPNFQTSLFANASRSYGQSLFDKTIGINLSQDLNNGQWRYNVGGQWGQKNGEDNWQVKLSLVYKLSDLRRLRFINQSKGKRTRLEYSKDSDQRYVGALNVRAGVEENDQDKVIFDLNTQYNANRFLTSFDHASYYDQFNSQSARHQSRISFSSSIAFAGNNWAIGKPIYNSFALVEGHSSLKDKKISIDKVDDKYRANNEYFDVILLNDITSYSRSTVSIDVDNLAPGYDLGSGGISFYPTYRSGYNVLIGTEANISVIATLLDLQKIPLSLQVGIAICSSDKKKKEHEFFTNKKGKFALTGLMPCKYDITLKNDNKSTFSIDVMKGEQLQRKGVIYVH